MTRHRLIGVTLIAILGAPLIALAAYSSYREFALDEPLIHAASRGDLPTIEAYVGQGANINCHADDGGLTPLMIATENDDAPCVEWMVRHEADPMGRDNSGRNSLDVAPSQRMRQLLSEHR